MFKRKMRRCLQNNAYEYWWFLPFTDFSLGLDLTSSPTGLDNRSLASALNVELTPQKGLTKRNGLKILLSGSVEMIGKKIIDLYNYYSSYGNYIVVNLDNLAHNYLWLHDGASWINLGLTLSKKECLLLLIRIIAIVEMGLMII